GCSGIGDRRVRADETTQAFGNFPRASLECRVLQHLIGFHSVRGQGREERHCKKQNEGRSTEAHGYSAAGTVAALVCARLGAPMRRRRSDSETAPPMNIVSAPSQMRRTSALK